VGAAFDSVSTRLTRLEGIKNKSGIAAGQLQSLKKLLKAIDQVWGVLL
jgi:hypothetical protein